LGTTPNPCGKQPGQNADRKKTIIIQCENRPGFSFYEYPELDINTTAKIKSNRPIRQHKNGKNNNRTTYQLIKIK
jgi:hypothetical protein